MTETTARKPIRASRPARTHASSASAATAPARVVPNEVILERSTPPTSGSAPAPASPAGTGPTTRRPSPRCRVGGVGQGDRRRRDHAEQIGGVVVSTVSHLNQTPAVGTEIADKLGTDKAAAFDISAGCAGFGYGLTLAKGMVLDGSAEYVLVIGVERLSDLTDRRTAPRPSSSATARARSSSAPPRSRRIGPTVWGSEGDKPDRSSSAWTVGDALFAPDGPAHVRT